MRLNLTHLRRLRRIEKNMAAPTYDGTPAVQFQLVHEPNFAQAQEAAEASGRNVMVVSLTMDPAEITGVTQP